MKYYSPQNAQPGLNEFHQFTRGKLSDAATRGLSYRATASLFTTARKLYDTLKNATSEQLSVFANSKKYLSQRQEHDLMALTAQYTAQLDLQLVRDIIEQDTATSDAEKALLLAAVELYKASATASYSALGSPRWVEDITEA